MVEGQSVVDGFRNVYFSLLPVEFASGLLTAGIAYAYQGENLSAVALVAVIGLVFQYLLRTALNSMDRKDQLEGRTRELASLQVGLLGTVLQTLSLRDKMTARHSAAVARYSREIASELGLSEREQDVVHTAALLHDIGKFIFPDSILFASTRLSSEDLEIVRRHPEQGARLVARMDGYGPVAEIVLAHHERIDGAGYPNGLSGEQIPLPARIIAVADTYDVMTARDSYRRPVSSRDAIAELRRVSAASSMRPWSRRSSVCWRSAPSRSATPTTLTSSASSTWIAGSGTTRSRASPPRSRRPGASGGRRPPERRGSTTEPQSAARRRWPRLCVDSVDVWRRETSSLPGRYDRARLACSRLDRRPMQQFPRRAVKEIERQMAPDSQIVGAAVGTSRDGSPR